MPRGTAKIRVAIFMRISYAVCSLTPMYFEARMKISNSHQGVHIIGVTGIEIARYSPHSVKDSYVGQNNASYISGM